MKDYFPYCFIFLNQVLHTNKNWIEIHTICLQYIVLLIDEGVFGLVCNLLLKVLFSLLLESNSV